MTFNRQLASDLANEDDRDIAPFFVGREAEIRAFDIAVHQATRKPQAIFRIYQGPPGCGKTSLAAHLAKIRADNTLFVPIDPEHLVSTRSLMEGIRAATLDTLSDTAKLGATIIAAVGARVGLTPITDAAREAVTTVLNRDLRLVLHLDEAHAIVPDSAEALRKLHTTGLGVPCVMAMTGLGHTASRVTSINGLSRLASDAVIDMGEMSKDECALSTTRMLVALDVSTRRDMLEDWAARVAELSHLWPQHLKGAQSALCGELLRVDGVADDVDMGVVRADSDARRIAYYTARLNHPVFQIDGDLTKRILVDIAEAELPDTSQGRLRQVCEVAIERGGFSDWPEFQSLPRTAFSDALLEKGIVSGKDGRFAVAIPSMVDWAADELGGE